MLALDFGDGQTNQFPKRKNESHVWNSEEHDGGLFVTGVAWPTSHSMLASGLHHGK